MSTSITAAELGGMIARIKPHASKDSTLPSLCAIRFEADGDSFFLAATDRYTMAISRAITINTKPWHGRLSRNDFTAAEAWLGRIDPTAILSISAEQGNEQDVLTFSAGSDQLHLATPTRDGKHFPDWRAIVSKLLKADPEPVNLSCLDSRYLARFKAAGRVLYSMQASATAPVILTTDDGFLGLQMPINAGAKTRADLADGWLQVLTRGEAAVGDRTYDLAATWADCHGDPWKYCGRNDRSGEPLMALVGIDDDPFTLAQLVAEYGPLSRTDA